MWPVTLSGRLLIVGLVGRYLTNYLIRRKPIYQRIDPFPFEPCDSKAYAVLAVISNCYPPV